MIGDHFLAIAIIQFFGDLIAIAIPDPKKSRSTIL